MRFWLSGPRIRLLEHKTGPIISEAMHPVMAAYDRHGRARPSWETQGSARGSGWAWQATGRPGDWPPIFVARDTEGRWRRVHSREPRGTWCEIEEERRQRRFIRRKCNQLSKSE